MMERLVMDQPKTTRSISHKILKPRRLALLASAAGLGVAMLLTGAGGYLPSNLPAAISGAHAAEVAPNAAGFGDLVAKVKPDVISVRVKIEHDGQNMPVLQQDDEVMNGDQQGSPFGPFSRQFRFGGPNGMPHNHQIITGQGSGFFISPDGYAVTNCHVVDHAKSVEITTDDGTIYTAKVVGSDRK